MVVTVVVNADVCVVFIDVMVISFCKDLGTVLQIAVALINYVKDFVNVSIHTQM